MKWIGLTDVGKVRRNNEDAYFTPKDKEPFFLLADGMGGHLGGERASALAITSLSEELPKVSEESSEEIKRGIIHAMEKANDLIYSESLSNPDYRGMGTTLSLLYIGEERVYFANIGDSRIYLFRDNELIQLTKDDSFVNYLLDVGEITEEEAINHPRKNVLTKALGTTPALDVEIHEKSREEGEIYLLCSDGLTAMVSFEEIEEILKDYSPEEAANRLMDTALKNGGRDNVTLILLAMDRREQ